MKTIIITNRKGGVGKTTTTVNLSAWLGILNKTVLIIDLDTQSHIQYGLGYTKKFKTGIHQAMEKKLDLNEIIYETEFKNVFLLPADINYHINNLKQDDRLLARVIRKSKIDKIFDICIIDTPPTSDILLSNALSISDYALIPVKTEYLGLIGVNQFLKIFYTTVSRINPKLELLGILPTMYNKSLKEHHQMIEFLEKKVGKNRVLNPIRNDIKLSLSFLEGKPIAYYDRRFRGSKDYETLAKQVLGVVDENNVIR
jgi:chromosome partitioning protein